MLVDDNVDDNFFHERVIKQSNVSESVIAKQTGMEALEYLKSMNDNNNVHPELILLDINMPGMNGWEFLEQYNQLEEKFKSKVVVIMLTTSENPDDKIKAEKMNMAPYFKTKPLTVEMIEDITEKYFK